MVRFFSIFLLVLALFVPSTQVLAAGLIPDKDTICGGSCPLFDRDFKFTDQEQIANFILSFARFLTYIGVALSVLFIVYGGLQLIFGQGEQGRKTIVTTIIGLIIIIIAYTLVSLIGGFLQGDALGGFLG